MTCEGEQSMQSGTELAREIQRTDWSTAGNLSNRSSGAQIPCDICTPLKCYLYSAKCSRIIKSAYLVVCFYLHKYCSPGYKQLVSSLFYCWVSEALWYCVESEYNVCNSLMEINTLSQEL